MQEKKERIMEAVSRLGSGISRAGDRLYEGTRYVIDLSKMRLRVKDAQYEIRREMEEIGRVYYESGGEATREEYASCVAKIGELREEIARLEQQMAQMQENRDFVVPSQKDSFEAQHILEDVERMEAPPVVYEESYPCPHCGELMSAKLAYCTNCHEKLG